MVRREVGGRNSEALMLVLGLQTDPGVLPPPVITKLPHARFVPILWLSITMKDER